MDKYYTYDSRSWLLQSHAGDDWVRTSVFMSIRMDDMDSVKRSLPEPCRECMWRRGRVCALPRCQKVYWGLGDDLGSGRSVNRPLFPRNTWSTTTMLMEKAQTTVCGSGRLTTPSGRRSHLCIQTRDTSPLLHERTMDDGL